MLAHKHLVRFAPLLLAAGLGGCVTPIAVRDQAIAPTYASAGTLLVAVVDERDSVHKEGKPPTYIGRAHVSFGIPVDMKVYPWVIEDSAKKNQTLAQALEERIVVGMKERGWKVIGAEMTSAPAADQVAQLLREQAADRLLVLGVTEWFVSVNLNWVGSFDFDWGVAVTVSGPSGSPLLSFKDVGQDEVELHAKQSPGNSVRLAYRERLTKVFERPDLQAALKAPIEPVRAQN
jgi:hypothetical protein